jgi:hypothetical protein
VFGLIISALQSPPAIAEDDVRYRIMPCLWTAGMDVEIGRPGMTTDADVEFVFDGSMDGIQIGLMITF